ncbi:phage protein [[Clostridium] sordellii]|nr:phage protein [[Clostridium] sordellii] [Paeniclostridium sordellii]
MRHMISPLDLEWDELLVYHQLYLRSDFSTGITEYTDRQIEDSLKKAKIGRKRIRRILNKFIDDGLFVEIAKGIKGKNPKPAIGKLVKIKDILGTLKEPNTNLKGTLKGIENTKDKDNNEPNTNLKGTLDDPLIKEKRIKNNIYSEIAERFNSTCNRLPKVIKITDKRKKSIDSRIKEYNQETIYKVFDTVANNKFLNGDNDRGWKADFDWIVNPNNFIKVLEGKYNNQEQQSQKQSKEEPKGKVLDMKIGRD